MGGRGAGANGLKIKPKQQKDPIELVGDAKDFKELQDVMQDHYNIYLDPSLKQIDLDTVKEQCYAIDFMGNMFGRKVVGEAIRSVQVDDGRVLPSNAFAACDGNGNIYLAKKYYEDTVYGVSQYDYSIRTGFHPSGTDFGKGVIQHEIGHALEAYLIKKDFTDGKINIFKSWDMWKKHTYAGKIVGEAVKNLNKNRQKGEKALKISEAMATISKYATHNKAETVAEAVADYMANYGNAKPLSREIVSVLQRML